MKPCDSCQQATALFFCTADEAYLCTTCDAWIHNANILSFKHKRLPLCEVCLETPATITSAVMPLCSPCEEALSNNDVPVLKTENSDPSSESVPLEAQTSVVDPNRSVAQQWAGGVKDSATVDEDDMQRLAEEAAGWLTMDVGCLEGGDGSGDLDGCDDLALTSADVAEGDMAAAEGAPSQDASEEEGNEDTAMNESEESNTTKNKDEKKDECTENPPSRTASPAPPEGDKTSATTSPAQRSDGEAAVVPKQEACVKVEPFLPPPLLKGGLLPPLSFEDVFDNYNAVPQSAYCQEVPSTKEGHEFPHSFPPHPHHAYYHHFYPHPLAHAHGYPHPHMVRSVSTHDDAKQSEAARKRIKTSGSVPSLSAMSSYDTSASPVPVLVAAVPSNSGSSTVREREGEGGGMRGTGGKRGGRS